ncbi:hypothetical protein N7457_004714 [Penicillium paradoxum]|uniref:uncharacterized protein n=1 Tax=Penicillium paradoxum TaxID=176176 RepID=UPI002549A627|nr:uncharacterized protein N7457_004714 [Penicillium paradoxum]KAJ5782940.1 hypothetical protein N7457_004714 [Penicillium paradoxum]
MTLQTLPIEILYAIIRFIGSDELRKQEGCGLLICKLWYKIARPVLLADLRLSATQLVQAPESADRKIRTYCRILTIDINGSGDWPGEHDIDKLNSKLNSLVDGNNYLRSFTLRARSHFDPAHPLAPRKQYITKWNPTEFFNMLGTSKLSHLVIDTYGSEMSGAVHICPRLGLQIPALRSVRLRMRSICPHIFGFSQGDSALPGNIECIIINLSLKDTDRFSTAFSHHCTEPRSAWNLYDEMITVGTEVAKKTPSLKVCKILCHKHPWPDMMTMDCITGAKTVLVGDTWDWGDEGVPDPDDGMSGNEFSLTDSDFSSASGI